MTVLNKQNRVTVNYITALVSAPDENPKSIIPTLSDLFTVITRVKRLTHFAAAAERETVVECRSDSNQPHIVVHTARLRNAAAP